MAATPNGKGRNYECFSSFIFRVPEQWPANDITACFLVHIGVEVPVDCHTDAAQIRALSAAKLPGWPVDIKWIRYLLNAGNNDVAGQ